MLNRIPRMFMEDQYWVPEAVYADVRNRLLDKQRTQQSHNHQFAAINDRFENLPASHAGAPYAASADAFRKHGLIATGHCDVETIDMGRHELALAAAPFISKTAKKAHGYAATIVRGPLIICATPHSQSYKAMGKERFQKSKDDVLRWADELLGVQA